MSTTSYEYAQGSMSTAEGTSGYSQMYFWVYAQTTVSNVKVYAAQKDINQDAYVTMVLRTSDGITAQETKPISGSRQEYGFSNTLSVNPKTWFNITFWTNNSVVYYDSASVADFISTGWTGSSPNPSTMIPYSSKFTITYDPIWTADAQNDGYARIVGYAPPADWEGFTKDADGYPTNWAAWKLDSQNEGYPWPTGFLPAHIVVGGIYKKVNGAFVPVQIYKKVNGTLVPVQLYKKVNGNLIPIL